MANGVGRKGEGHHHVAVGDQVAVIEGKKRQKGTSILDEVAVAGLEPEDAGGTEIANAAISEHGYDGRMNYRLQICLTNGDLGGCACNVRLQI